MRLAPMLVALTMSAAFAQDVPRITGRTYRFTGPAPSAREYQELATVIRTACDVREVTIDAAAGQITFGGPGESPEMSEWLLRELDKAPGPKPSEVPEFHSAQQDDNVAVFYLVHATGPRYTQEILTVLRTVADVQKIFSYTRLNALAVRGPAAQIAFTKWMVESLDKAAPVTVSKVPEFHINGVRDDTIRVYYLANARGVDDINRILTAIRTTGQIMKTFAVVENGAFAIRGRPEDMTKAEGILLTMDQQLAR